MNSEFHSHKEVIKFGMIKARPIMRKWNKKLNLNLHALFCNRITCVVLKKIIITESTLEFGRPSARIYLINIDFFILQLWTYSSAQLVLY